MKILQEGLKQKTAVERLNGRKQQVGNQLIQKNEQVQDMQQILLKYFSLLDAETQHCYIQNLFPQISPGCTQNQKSFEQMGLRRSCIGHLTEHLYNLDAY